MASGVLAPYLCIKFHAHGTQNQQQHLGPYRLLGSR